MQVWYHKIPFYHLIKRILWKLCLLYTDYLVSQKYILRTILIKSLNNKYIIFIVCIVSQIKQYNYINQI